MNFGFDVENTKAALEIKELATGLPLEGADAGWFEAPEALGTGEGTLQKGKKVTFHRFISFIFVLSTKHNISHTHPQ